VKKIIISIIVLLVIFLIYGVFMINKIFRTTKSEPEIKTVNQEISCLGMMTRTNSKDIMKDLPKLYERYMDYKKNNEIPALRKPWEYVSLSKNFKDDLSFDYFTGYVVDKINPSTSEPLISFSTPSGTYAVFKIQAKNKLFFGLTMALTKKYIYQTWIPNSKYEFSGFEYEYNNEEMNKINPYNIDLYVGLKAK
jgi:predicted transcriptional regulator YdeE